MRGCDGPRRGRRRGGHARRIDCARAASGWAGPRPAGRRWRRRRRRRCPCSRWTRPWSGWPPTPGRGRWPPGTGRCSPCWAGSRPRRAALPAAAARGRGAPGRARGGGDRRRGQGRRRAGGRRAPGAMLAGDLPDGGRAGLRRRRRGASRAVGPARCGRPVQPMLAATAADVAAALARTGAASVEWKLDGARVQIHRDGDEVRVFTRNLNDVTGRLDGVVAMARALARAARSCSTARPSGRGTGDATTAAPTRFQDTMSRVRPPRRRRPAPAWPCGSSTCSTSTGVDLLDEPLAERRGRARARSPARRRSRRVVTADAAEAPGLRSTPPSPPATRAWWSRTLDLAVRGRPAGRLVAQGEAGPHARPRGARRRVGPRPAPGLAVEPPPRRRDDRSPARAAATCRVS